MTTLVNGSSWISGSRGTEAIGNGVGGTGQNGQIKMEKLLDAVYYHIYKT